MLSGLLKQLVCVSFVPVMAVCRQEDNLFSLWLHDMSDVRLDALMLESVVQKGKLEDLMESLRVDGEQHLCLIREEKTGEYSLYTCDARKFYHSAHEQEGRRLFGTKEEIIHEVKLQTRK